MYKFLIGVLIGSLLGGIWVQHKTYDTYKNYIEPKEITPAYCQKVIDCDDIKSWICISDGCYKVLKEKQEMCAEHNL